MLILERIFDSLLFLSKKEIYKERKFSFLSYQNLRFWGKRDRTWHKSAISKEFLLLFGISKKFHDMQRNNSAYFRMK